MGGRRVTRKNELKFVAELGDPTFALLGCLQVAVCVCGAVPKDLPEVFIIIVFVALQSTSPKHKFNDDYNDDGVDNDDGSLDHAQRACSAHLSSFF